tara:strand:- start:411 stop:767 length:357 start_codon:yes stop_codon:yes gene_type:complete
VEKEKLVRPREKDLVVKLGPGSRVLAQSILDKANEGKQFKKKLNFKDMFDHLLNAYGEMAVPDLIKMREQPEDKLKIRYQQSGSSLGYYDWIEEQMAKFDEMGKKSSKRKKLEDKGVS